MRLDKGQISGHRCTYLHWSLYESQIAPVKTQKLESETEILRCCNIVLCSVSDLLKIMHVMLQEETKIDRKPWSEYKLTLKSETSNQIKGFQEAYYIQYYVVL